MLLVSLFMASYICIYAYVFIYAYNRTCWRECQHMNTNFQSIKFDGKNIFAGASPELIKYRFRRYFSSLFRLFSWITLPLYRLHLRNSLPRRYFSDLFRLFSWITLPLHRLHLRNSLLRRCFFSLLRLFSWIMLPLHRRNLYNSLYRRYSVVMLQYICKLKQEQPFLTAPACSS